MTSAWIGGAAVVCGQGKARDIWAHVGVLGALRDPGALGCGTQPFVRKAWRRPQAFSSDPKIRGSQGPSRGRGGFLGRGCCADGTGRMWLFPVPWAREWKEGPNSPFWELWGASLTSLCPSQPSSPSALLFPELFWGSSMGGSQKGPSLLASAVT